MPLRVTYDRTKGAFVLLYGPNNVGKTASTLATCDLPVAYIMSEPRDIYRNIDVANKFRSENKLPLLEPGKNMFIFDYENYDDLIRFMSTDDDIKWDNIATMIIDSMSHIMNMELMCEIIDEAHEGRMEKLSASKGKAAELTKDLASKNKSTEEGYGVLASAMKRLAGAAGRKTRTKGMAVICLALEDEKPRMVDGNYIKVPLFAGRDFGKNVGGLFDFIGKVQPHVVDKDGKKVIEYPPQVWFESPKQDFQAKWTGLSDKQVRAYRLDLREILK